MTTRSGPAVRVNLPLREDLYRGLEMMAAAHNFTLTEEIRTRLEDSFDRDTQRGFALLLRDMEINWARFSARFLRIDLAEQLAEAVMRNEVPENLKPLAELILKHGETERRRAGGVS